MKRLLLLLGGAAAAFAIWYGISGSGKASRTALQALLPRDTLAFVYLPDLSKTREQWRQSDLYKLWTEPAVQEFLSKPLAQAPKTSSAREWVQELDTLGMKEAFLAIIAWENNQPKLAGGFRFKGGADDAEKIVGRWRSRVQQNAPAAVRETVTHRQHRLDVVRQDAVTLATAYHRDRFFAANDVDLLKQLLDRADGTTGDAAQTLGADENYVAAMKHLPADYAAMAYARFDRYFEQLKARLPAGSATGDQLAALRQIRTAALATGFQDGKIRDVLFVGMPRTAESGELTRASLVLATEASFLYTATFLNLSQRLSLPATRVSGAPAFLQRLIDAFARSGITADDWNKAFGAELGIVGDWPANSRIPALFATLPVQDLAGANQIIAAMTSAAPEGGAWTQSARDGVNYYSLPPANPMIPVTPTIAVAEKFAIAGVDPISVEAATKRSRASNSELAAAESFTAAEALVPKGRHLFTYLDTALLYQRLDAALRPMLVMGAAFVPAIAEAVDLAKLPAPDVVSRHLSPIVVSQRYESEGYVTESVGPVSIYQAVLGIAGATGAGTAWYQRETQRAGAGGAVLPQPPPVVPAAPSPPLPAPSPSETPP
jgi:hypothetical protein